MIINNANLLSHCMSYVEDVYLKVLRINFTDATFEICKLADGVEPPEYSNIDEWINHFANSDNLHPDDVEKFKAFADGQNIRKWIAETDKGIYCSYRRKAPDGKYIHTSLCVIRDKENYSKKHEYGILYVKDINSIYETEYEFILEDLGTTDSFTKLLNRFAFQRDISRYKGGNVGVIFADLNGLKYLNDTQGHAAGDKLILDFACLLKSAFPDFKVYHISGDEFVVIAYDTNLRSFLQRTLAWHRWVWEQGDHPMASVGYSLDANVTDIAEIVADAEKAMYTDKQIFYGRYPKYKR